MKNARFDCQGPLSNWSYFDGGSTRRDLVLASLFISFAHGSAEPIGASQQAQ